MYRDYSKKDVQFYYVYKALAHPERDGHVQPVTIKERLTHVKLAKKQLETDIPWIADSMANDLKHALGDRPNSEFVIDPEGKIIHARSWSDPAQLRNDLAALVGKVEPATTVADLKRKNPGAEKRPAEKGIVERVPKPEGAEALKVVAKQNPDDETPAPFYAKLRAEAVRDLTRNGSGTIHLGFHLDPIYQVHWNNLAKPLEFEFEAPESGSLTPLKAVAKKVENAESDVDPREFLIEARDLDRNEPLRLTVRYFACNDEEGWCIPVTQTYSIHLEIDRDAGRVAERGGRRGGGRGAGGRRVGSGGVAPGGPGRMLDLLEDADKNEDGKISRDEFEGPERFFDRLDQDQNDELSKEEIDKATERMRQGRGTRDRGRPRE